MLIAHISDFHVFSRSPETSLVRADAAAAADKVVADLAAFRPALDAVMFTGDLTDGGSAADYALLRDLLAPLSVPIFVVPGNHDKRATLREAFAGSIPFADPEFLHYDVAFRGLRVLALDTLVDGRVEGRLCARRLEWIGERLSETGAEPLCIIMHHPPFPTGIGALDRMSLVEGADALGRLVASAFDRCPHPVRPYPPSGSRRLERRICRHRRKSCVPGRARPRSRCVRTRSSRRALCLLHPSPRGERPVFGSHPLCSDMIDDDLINRHA